MALICTQIMYWPGNHFIIHEKKLRNAERGWTLIMFLPSSTKLVNCPQQWQNWIGRQQDRSSRHTLNVPLQHKQFWQMVKLKTIHTSTTQTILANGKIKNKKVKIGSISIMCWNTYFFKTHLLIPENMHTKYRASKKCFPWISNTLILAAICLFPAKLMMFNCYILEVKNLKTFTHKTGNLTFLSWTSDV